MHWRRHRGAGGHRCACPSGYARGLTVQIGSVFDGWGYAHLYDAKTSAHRRLRDHRGDRRAVRDRASATCRSTSSRPTRDEPRVHLVLRRGDAGPALRPRPASRRWASSSIRRQQLLGRRQFTDAAGNRLIAAPTVTSAWSSSSTPGRELVLAPARRRLASALRPWRRRRRRHRRARRRSLFTFGSLRRLDVQQPGRPRDAAVPGRGRVTRPAQGERRRGDEGHRDGIRDGDAARAACADVPPHRGDGAVAAADATRRPTRRTGGALRARVPPAGGTGRTRNKNLSIAMRLSSTRGGPAVIGGTARERTE